MSYRANIVSTTPMWSISRVSHDPPPSIYGGSSGVGLPAVVPTARHVVRRADRDGHAPPASGAEPRRIELSRTPRALRRRPATRRAKLRAAGGAHRHGPEASGS